MATLWVWEYRVLLLSGRWSAWKPEWHEATVSAFLNRKEAEAELPRDEDATEFRLSKYVREWTA